MFKRRVRLRIEIPNTVMLANGQPIDGEYDGKLASLDLTFTPSPSSGKAVWAPEPSL